ncbi:MAG: hypothetical protein CMJ58_19850 [Planctomycetaceae bacterium]|nr:hypothetical protein [Planctomycetaceae bacterium]
MSRFEINLATPADDAALRQLLAATPMEGDIRLAFAREPSYFAASPIDGPFTQVVVARDLAKQRIIGMGSRAVFDAYVNGCQTPVGYLSGLRLAPEFRRRTWLLARGYRLFRHLHNDNRAAFYLTTIAADNQPAQAALLNQRAGLPIYRPWGRFHTLTIAPQRPRRVGRDNLDIRAATAADAPAIADFLRRNGPRRQFFPALEADEFAGRPTRFAGLVPDAILLATVDEQLVGTLGLWDQRAYRQVVATAYSRRLRMLRPAYNMAAALRGRARLPRVGESLNVRYATTFVTDEDCPDVAQALLQAAAARLPQDSAEMLLVGLHESDPLLPAIRSSSGREYVTLLYLVYWPDAVPNLAALSERTPYLELGCL